jgi:hypothetical protein
MKQSTKSSSAVDRTRETNPASKCPHWPGLTNYKCCIIFRSGHCRYPRRVFCVWLNGPPHSPLQTEVGTRGGLTQTILQGHHHSMIRVMSKSPSHDLIFIPIDLICRPDHIIQKSHTKSRHSEVRPQFYQALAFIEHTSSM